VIVNTFTMRYCKQRKSDELSPQISSSLTCLVHDMLRLKQLINEEYFAMFVAQDIYASTTINLFLSPNHVGFYSNKFYLKLFWAPKVSMLVSKEVRLKNLMIDTRLISMHCPNLHLSTRCKFLITIILI